MKLHQNRPIPRSEKKVMIIKVHFIQFTLSPQICDLKTTIIEIEKPIDTKQTDKLEKLTCEFDDMHPQGPG